MHDAVKATVMEERRRSAGMNCNTPSVTARPPRKVCDDIAVSVNYGAGVLASTSSVDAVPALLTVGGTA